MQQILITVFCPSCNSENILKNGKKSNQKQNYLCVDCKRQFTHDNFLSYNGSKSNIDKKILLMLVRGCGVRDIAIIEQISVNKVLSVIKKSNYTITPKHKHYKYIEIDEFWTFVKSKKDKKWLIYAYSRKTNEILAYVWGDRDLETAQKLRQKIIDLSITYDYITIDRWHSFMVAFEKDNKLIGKYHTLSIERNNCRLRHRVKRAMRKTCSFSKSFEHHKKVFDLVFYYINYNHV